MEEIVVPPTKPSSPKAGSIVKLRITAAEKIKLTRLGENFGGVSEFIRRAVNNFAGAGVFDNKCQQSSGILQNSVSWHLSRIGNNLNQLAYVINKANIANKVNDKLAKEIVRELMYLNIQVNEAIERDLAAKNDEQEDDGEK
ncbi:MAG: MobC protein [Campylobacterota bacterium]|nr:MobC protein [Campylobacterota bacterium]